MSPFKTPDITDQLKELDMHVKNASPLEKFYIIYEPLFRNCPAPVLRATNKQVLEYFEDADRTTKQPVPIELFYEKCRPPSATTLTNGLSDRQIIDAPKGMGLDDEQRVRRYKIRKSVYDARSLAKKKNKKGAAAVKAKANADKAKQRSSDKR
jgi:hypothetical protein